MDGYALVVKTAPTDEPITPEELRQWMREHRSEGDAELTGLIQAAREQLEIETRRAYMKTVYTLKLKRFWTGVLELPRPPLLSVDEIRYVDSDGNSQTTSVFSTETRWRSSPFGAVFLAKDQEWPSVEGAAHVLEVEIDFTAGYSSGNTAAQRTALPWRFLAALRQLAVHYADNREVVGPDNVRYLEIPRGITDLVAGLRVPVLPGEGN